MFLARLVDSESKTERKYKSESLFLCELRWCSTLQSVRLREASASLKAFVEKKKHNKQNVELSISWHKISFQCHASKARDLQRLRNDPAMESDFAVIKF